MNRARIINIVLVILCVAAICINYFFEDFKAIGAGCILLMGILAIWKEKMTNKNN